jgi:serine/threonine protein kinase
LKHENIIELFATYGYGPYFNLLMPWADRTLFDYLRSTEPPDHADARASLFNEMACVASALDAIHNFQVLKDGIEIALMGCHHDLKPQNILVRGEKFLIADFGLARFKELDQQSRTRWKLGTTTYGPPEIGSDTKIGRPHDIWSFGCILSEVATFALLGHTGVLEFDHKRRTDIAPGKQNDYFHNNEAVKPEVLAWLEHLNRSEQDGSILVSLVTSLVRKLLDPNPNTRPGSKFVHAELAQIVQIYGSSNLSYVQEKSLQRQAVNGLVKDESKLACAASGQQSQTHLEEHREEYQSSDLGGPKASHFLLNDEKMCHRERATWPMIHVAASRGESQTVHKILILEHPHASISTNDEGNTALHIAAEYGQVAVIDVILAFSSSHLLLTNIALRKNASGKTALHLTAENGNKECAIRLREKMPDDNHVRDLLEEKDDFGNTPKDLAKQNGHIFMFGCLSSAEFCC